MSKPVPSPINSASNDTPATTQSDTLSRKVIYSIYLLLGAAAAFLGAQIIGPFFVAFIALGFGVKSQHLVSLLDNNASVRFLLIFSIEALTVWGVMMLLRRRGWKWSTIGLGRKPAWSDLSKGMQIYGIYFLIFIAVYFLELATHLINTDQGQQLGFTSTHGLQLIYVFLSLVLLPPIAEEILFRGFIFMGLRKKLPFIHAALITGLLFAVAHLEFGSGQPLNWAAAVDTFTLSCVLTYAVEKTHSLWPNMVVHTAKNLLAFLLLFVLK